SRGRHTRFSRDWSSDVCSSDLILADAWPVYVDPVYDPELGLWLPPPPAAWERAMDEHPDAAAVLVTYPTYEGVALDLQRVAEAEIGRASCRDRGWRGGGAGARM